VSQIQAQKDNTGKAANALHSYATLSCRALCNKVKGTFPREVRDMIYKYLNPRWPHGVVCDPCETDVFQVCTFGLESRLFRHLIDARFVGKDTMKEIQEAFLRTTTFMFSRNVGSLTKFRITDSLGLGFLPVELVLNLEMHIQMGEYKFVGMRRNSQLLWGWANPHRAPAEVLHNLELFFGFKAGTTLTINCDMFAVEIDADNGPQQWLFDEVVPFLFPTICRLSAAGIKVKIRLGHDDFILPTYDNSCSLEKWSAQFLQVCLTAVIRVLHTHKSRRRIR
jgi:hypothetical protein